MPDVLINGTSKLARAMFHLLLSDDRYRVVAFTADARYCTDDMLLGVPLIAHDDIEGAWSPDDVEVLSVLGGLSGWEPRRDHAAAMIDRGYRHGNYVHPTAIVQSPPQRGTNTIVFPFVTLGFDGEMGDDVIVRENAYIGHDFVIGDHVFVGVACTIGGAGHLGAGSYVAMGSTVTNDTRIGEGAFVGIGSLVLRDVPARTRVFGHPAGPRGETKA